MNGGWEGGDGWTHKQEVGGTDQQEGHLDRGEGAPDQPEVGR